MKAHHQKRSHVLLAITFLSILASCNLDADREREASLKPSSKPNVLFIISDDLSAEALGAYGNTDCHTPHIDQLASQGILFNRMYSQYPVCGPSRAAIMSGMYPQSLGIMGNGQSNRFDSLIADRPSMAEHFKLNGYTTTRLSKIYHMRVPGDITAGVDGPDHKDSWDNAYNFRGAEWMSEGVHSHLSKEKLQFKKDVHYNLGFGSAFYTVKTKNNGESQPDYRATTKAIEILKSHRPEVDQPFFLSVGYIRPHVPLVAPAADFEKYEARKLQLPSLQNDDLSDIPALGITRTSEHFGITEKTQQQEVLAAYYASVSFMDTQVGRLIEAIDSLNLRKNTIIVFTSDHGYHLGEHGFWQKLSLHEESTRIPFIISAPGNKASTSNTICEQIDIYPTLANLANLDVPKHVQGDVLPTTQSEPFVHKNALAYSVTNKGGAIRTDSWTYIRYNDGAEELYDMKADPRQINNLALHEGFTKVKEEMRQLYKLKESDIL